MWQALTGACGCACGGVTRVGPQPGKASGTAFHASTTRTTQHSRSCKRCEKKHAQESLTIPCLGPPLPALATCFCGVSIMNKGEN
eukprot:1682111-Pyramimonas_sp.AAC.1